MARDYAAGDRRRSVAPGGLPGWIWLTAGLSIGLVIAVIVYIGRPAQPMPSVTARQQQSVATPKKPRVVVPPAEDPEFDFYRLLEGEQEIAPSAGPRPKSQRPTRQVKPEPAEPSAAPEPVVAMPSPPPKKPPAPTAAPTPPSAERYIVLAGSFKNPDYAQRHKAKLALAGIESQIETVAAGGDTFHRVRIGPRESLASAEAVLRQLRINGFDGRVVRQR